MTNQKKLSRRDAIKLLGAATGASLLANLPSKWNKPELTGGVLPAHAQTSGLGLKILSCNLTLNILSGVWSSSPVVGPLSTIPTSTCTLMQFTISFTNTHFASGSDPQSPNPYINNWCLDPSTGTVLYVNDANSVLPGPMAADAGAQSGSISILWEFADPSLGSGTCTQTLSWP